MYLLHLNVLKFARLLNLVLEISKSMYFFSRANSNGLSLVCSLPISRISQPLWLTNATTRMQWFTASGGGGKGDRTNGLYRRDVLANSVSVCVCVCVWLVGIINYMRVIGTINGSVSKTGCTTYAHCPLPVGGIERDRRHNLAATLSLRAKSSFHFNEKYFWKQYVICKDGHICGLGCRNSLLNIFIPIKIR